MLSIHIRRDADTGRVLAFIALDMDMDVDMEVGFI